MKGRLAVVGIGPGSLAQLTAEASEAIAAASDLFGYGPYLARLRLGADQRVHASDNREELARARAALRRHAGAARRAASARQRRQPIHAIATKSA